MGTSMRRRHEVGREPSWEPDSSDGSGHPWPSAVAGRWSEDGLHTPADGTRRESVPTDQEVPVAVSRAAPVAVRPAAARKATGMLLAAPTRPRMMGPPLNPRSMNTLAVPAALPR